MSRHKIKTTSCPGCGELLDGVTGLSTEELPEPGDLSVCGYCAAPLRFDVNLNVEPVPAAEMPELLAEYPEWGAAIFAVRAAIITNQEGEQP